MALNDKQQRFCDEYLVDLNATQAAIKAGYSEKTAKVQGSRLLTNANVKAYIAERMEAKESELIASQDEVLRYLTAVLRGDSESSVLARNMVGADEVITKPPDEKERLKAAELLGKRYSLFNEKVKLDVTPVVIGGDDSLED